MEEMSNKARDGPASGRTAQMCQNLRKKDSPRRRGLGKALPSVSAKASLPRLPRQCHSHGPGLPQEPGKASHEGRLSRQISDSPRSSGRPHPHTSFAGSQGLHCGTSLQGCGPSPGSINKDFRGPPPAGVSGGHLYTPIFTHQL